MGRGGWKLLEVRGRGGRGRSGARAGTRDAGARWGRGGAQGGRAGHRPRPLPGPAPRAPTAGGQGAGAPVASPSSASPGSVAGERRGRPERQAGHGHHQHHGLHPAAAPQQRRAAAHRPGTRGGPAGTAPSPPPPRPCAIRAEAGTRDPGRGLGRGRREEATRLLLSARCLAPAVPPPPAAHPAPTPPGQPAGAPGTDVRACMLGPAPCHSSARPGACVHRVVGDRSPEAASSACGHGCRQCVERLCFGGAGVSVPCARGTRYSMGKGWTCLGGRCAGHDVCGVEEASSGVGDRLFGTVCVEVRRIQEREATVWGKAGRG